MYVHLQNRRWIKMVKQKETKMVKLTIDGRSVEVPENTTILEAAKKIGIHIPTLCYHPDLEVKALCRVCVVKIEGESTLKTACSTPVADGMVVHTNTPEVRKARKLSVELLLSRHPFNCLECYRNGNCELQKLAETLNIREVRFSYVPRAGLKDEGNPAIVRDPSKCILCRRCISVCQTIQTVNVFDAKARGYETHIDPPYEKGLNNIACVYCGQCIIRCPTAAIHEKDNTKEVWEALNDSSRFVVVQTAPAVRASIGEEFGMPPGSLVTGKMVAALRRLGFDKVFDTDFTADLTIVEEANELVNRIKNNGKIPMFTSCSPGWIKFIEHFYPEYLDHISTCKSPQQMFGAIAKTYYAQKIKIDPSKMVVVSIMPCTAKKFEATRDEMSDSGFQDVDYVLTTREAAKMIKEAGIDFVNLEDEEFDEPLGISTGAGVIFGASGGVMEAALRTAYEIVTGKELKKVDFENIRGLEGLRTAEVDLDGLKLKVAVANGLSNARQVMEMLRNGEADFHFIEIMACPGGCLGGGGQPIPTNEEIRKARARAIYEQDKLLPVRQSHKNPVILELYKEFLEKPNSHIAHKLLHTNYKKRYVFF